MQTDCARLCRVLARVAKVPALLLALGAAGAVQALMRCMLPRRGRAHWKAHDEAAKVIMRLADVPSLLAFMRTLKMRDWLMEVMRDPAGMPLAKDYYAHVLHQLPADPL